jgi:hypothetical protein
MAALRQDISFRYLKQFFLFFSCVQIFCTKTDVKFHILTSVNFLQVSFLCSLMVMQPHTKYHWSISTDKNVMARTRKYYFKKQLFDLEVKGQGPTKVIMVFETPPYAHAPTHQIWQIHVPRDEGFTLIITFPLFE